MRGIQQDIYEIGSITYMYKHVYRSNPIIIFYMMFHIRSNAMYENALGELLLGLSLTLSGPIHEVRRAQVIQQSLEPLESIL